MIAAVAQDDLLFLLLLLSIFLLWTVCVGGRTNTRLLNRNPKARRNGLGVKLETHYLPLFVGAD